MAEGLRYPDPEQWGRDGILPGCGYSGDAEGGHSWWLDAQPEGFDADRTVATDDDTYPSGESSGRRPPIYPQGLEYRANEEGGLYERRDYEF
ncbi:MAG TPA: hypothetical protein VLE73_00525 [Candidatus Saccharimonadales bacterium]|nr:hypothetical protein [Candidatus Saccharimonadales bacterium]